MDNRYEVIRERDGAFFDSLESFQTVDAAKEACLEYAAQGEDGWDYEVWDSVKESVIFRASNDGTWTWTE